MLLWFGGKMVLVDKTLDASSFIAYMGLAYNILPPAKAISKASYGVRKGNAAAERVLEILESENLIQNAPNAIEKQDFHSEIEIRNVSFKYPKERPLLW